MPKLLDSLCKDFKTKTPKLTEFILNGEVLTNLQLCFINQN